MPAHKIARNVVQTAAAFLLVLVALLGAGLVSCAAFQPQRDVAALCTRIADRSAGVICIKASYAAIRDAGDTVLRRYDQGRMSPEAARTAWVTLERAYEAAELAEVAVLAGDWRNAETQLDAAISLLNTLEGLQ